MCEAALQLDRGSAMDFAPLRRLVFTQAASAATARTIWSEWSVFETIPGRSLDEISRLTRTEYKAMA
jgi:hypothetical protein